MEACLTDPTLMREQLLTSPRLLRGIGLAALLLMTFSAVRFQAPHLVGQAKELTDFDTFHIAGTLAAQGMPAASYDPSALFAAQRAATGTDTLMPWTYPPPFLGLMELFALLPVGLGFALFAAASAALFLLVLRRIAADCLPGALIAVLPAVFINLRTGQNGLLIAGLIGACLLLHGRSLARAGFPLGLLVIKPHLAAGAGLLTLLDRRWPALALAAATTGALLIASTLAYGTQIWPAFMGSVRDAGTFLSQGQYPLHRMSSLYAFARSLGAPAPAALAIQAGGALAALLLLTIAWQKRIAPRHLAAAACMASLFFSPYGYDYDVAIAGIAAGFVLRDLMRLASSGELLALFGLSWWATGYGLAVTVMVTPGMSSGVHAANPALPSLIAPALVALVILAVRVLARETQPQTAASV